MIRKLLFQMTLFKLFVPPYHLCEKLGTCEEQTKTFAWTNRKPHKKKAQMNSSLMCEYPGKVHSHISSHSSATITLAFLAAQVPLLK